MPSAASVAVMAGLGATTISARDDFVQGGQTNAADRDRAVTLKTATNVMIGVSAAFAATGIILFAIAPRRAKASAAFLLAPAKASVRGEF